MHKRYIFEKIHEDYNMDFEPATKVVYLPKSLSPAFAMKKF
jgi:hypothetical protein